MLTAQGLGAPLIYIAPVFATMISIIALTLYILIYWLGKPENKYKRCWFAGILACWVFYQIAFPPYVSSDSLTQAATEGAPLSRLIEKVGPPHSTSEISNTEIMWYYETGYLANRTFGVTINRSNGKVVDWYVQ